MVWVYDFRRPALACANLAPGSMKISPTGCRRAEALRAALHDGEDYRVTALSSTLELRRVQEGKKGVSVTTDVMACEELSGLRCRKSVIGSSRLSSCIKFEHVGPTCRSPRFRVRVVDAYLVHGSSLWSFAQALSLIGDFV